MAITKTNFINYTRCSRYVSLDKEAKEKGQSKTSYDEYKNEEELENAKELLGDLVENTENNLNNKQTEAMLPFYKMVEIEAGKITKKYFPGLLIYASLTKNQKSFSFKHHEFNYICYVDIYNEYQDKINIIEVKATTSKKYLNLESGYKGKPKYSIFKFDPETNCYKLKDEIKDYKIEEEMPFENYQKEREKLFDRWSEVGGYVFDLAVQRLFIEEDYKSKQKNANLENIHYYLAVLNHRYIFDGTYKDSKPLYSIDKNNQEVITFIDLTKVTKEYLETIKNLWLNLEENLINPSPSKCLLGKFCERKNIRECPYLKNICGKNIPLKNSSLNYLNNQSGFKMPDGQKLKGLDLINHGYFNMVDIPEKWLTNPKHIIQRNAVSKNIVYVDKEKIRKGLETLEYPIYHLDFETFPCPLPRFKGESPYTQSPFEFSLHIEHSPGKCDKNADNYIFLAKSNIKDEREELIKSLLKNIDPSKGTLFAQNVSFEKGRIEELARMFPKYQKELMKIYDRGFDLLWLINTNVKMYEKLGFDEKRSSLFNYYNKDLSGSYSIKKTLPIFSNLSYQDLEVKNGTEAIITYANYNNMDKDEFKEKYEALKTYCSQDTWAMVVILDGLRNISK